MGFDVAGSVRATEADTLVSDSKCFCCCWVLGPRSPGSQCYRANMPRPRVLFSPAPPLHPPLNPHAGLWKARVVDVEVVGSGLGATWHIVIGDHSRTTIEVRCCPPTPPLPPTTARATA